jgi:plasmid replication initiation protein
MGGTGVDNSDSRLQVVVKSNDLVQQTRYNLSLQEQKIILFVISKIKPTDEAFKEYVFDIKELCDICGITHDKTNFAYIKKSLQSIRDKSFWVKIDDRETVCSWILKPNLYPKSSVVGVILDEDLKPFLLQLREHFTSYELGCVLVMQSKYSIRLYEILKSYAYLEEIELSLVKIREQMMITKYEKYQDFRRNVLEKAIDEINTYTDLNVSFTPVRQSRVIVGLRFCIRTKSSVEQFVARMDRNVELDKNKR